MATKSEKLHARALELFHAKQLPQALDVYRQLFKLNGNDAQAWHMAGAIAGMSGDFTAARTYSEQAIRLLPNLPHPRLNLAKILHATGDITGAMNQYKRVLELSPGNPQALTGIAALHLQQGDYAVAISSLRQVVQNNPQNAEAFNLLGNAYRETSRTDLAIDCYQQAIRTSPDYVDAICNLGTALSGKLRFREADSCYSKALQIHPGNPAVLHARGTLYQSMGEYDKARSCYGQAFKANPSDAEIRSSLASLHERCGDRESAMELLEPLLQSGHPDANTAITYARICSSRSNREAAIRVLEDLLNKPQRRDDTIDLLFSLGEQYNKVERYDEAFDCFRQANDMDAAESSSPDYPALFRSITEFYDSSRWPVLPRSTVQSKLPVFIVGMPRTGTSLVEQILASHPQVTAGGERSDIFTLLDTLKSVPEQNKVFPGLVEGITTNALTDLATRHIDSITSLSEGRMRFTDKTPLHGLLLGFINQLLPGSRVIICGRDPLDTCLSIYFHRFNAFHGYARQLDTLGTFCKEYSSLMKHWMNTLDISMLHIQYEDLVKNPDTTIRQLLGFCGLDWNEDCLSFYNNSRTVNTPSYNQVRRPIYTSSIERWKHYEKFLDPLVTALKPR
jgi:tetratricopeptide (TPR) repeat protein